MKATLEPGIRHSATLTVTDALTVPRVSSSLPAFSDMPPVFATAYLVAFIEATCIECIQAHLEEGEHSVGTHVDVSHVVATPAGMTVTSEVELFEVEGRRLRFKVRCRDDKDIISEGFHNRAVIRIEGFLERVSARLTE
ncbi:MAG: thioesterase family protein [Betaproteobacteria bacterium]|nr:thioesterase family protein [Betaproteobacteria bacterium]